MGSRGLVGGGAAVGGSSGAARLEIGAQSEALIRTIVVVREVACRRQNWGGAAPTIGTAESRHRRALIRR